MRRSVLLLVCVFASACTKNVSREADKALAEACRNLSPLRVSGPLTATDLYFIETIDGENRRSSCPDDCLAIVQAFQQAGQSADLRPRAIFYEDAFYAAGNSSRLSAKAVAASTSVDPRDWAIVEGWWGVSVADVGNCPLSGWSTMADGAVLVRTQVRNGQIWCMRVEPVSAPTADAAVFQQTATSTRVSTQSKCVLRKVVNEIRNENASIALSENIELICPAIAAGIGVTDCGDQHHAPIGRELLMLTLSAGLDPTP